VDGTRALICGLPSWTTLVALLEEGEPVAGFIDAPALDELMIGLPGGTTLNGQAGAGVGLHGAGGGAAVVHRPLSVQGAEAGGVRAGAAGGAADALRL
jgi:hypothetical protein